MLYEVITRPPRAVRGGLAAATGHRISAARPVDRYPGVHVARAGGDDRRGRRHAQRRLLARGAALRTARRGAALRVEGAVV